MTSVLSVYLPMDRRQALAQHASVPEQSSGVALLADISGFTPRTETLVRTVGPQRGAEEIATLLNQVYGALIHAVDTFGGSVICFSGDAITCWFTPVAADRTPLDAPFPPTSVVRRATACALAMQHAMEAFAAVPLPGGRRVALSLKVAVSAGQARRLLVGDPAIQQHEVLAGHLLDRVFMLQAQAQAGEVLMDSATAHLLGPHGVMATHAPTEEADVIVVAGMAEAEAPQPWSALPEPLADTVCQPWLLPAVAVRLAHTPESLLAELRPVVALMLAFPNGAFDGDDHNGSRLDAFIRWVQRVVTTYEGAVIDLNMAEGSGNGYLYAAWGAPSAHDDDAVRAVAAARSLLISPPEGAEYVPLRIGLTRGMVWSGAYGGPTRRTYGVIGDATNLAFRLMRQAPEGTIWCDYAVLRAAERRWRFIPLPPVRVKGKAGLIPVYTPTAPSEQRVLPAASSLVGREAEQAQLAAALDDVVAGKSRVVVLEGEAGIGKSLLVEALAQQIRARGLVGLVGAGQSIERQTPYRAWRDIIGSFFGLDGVTDMAVQRARVETTVRALRPDLLGLLPLLNDMLYLAVPETPQTRALDPAQRGESLTSLLIALLSAWASEQPLIVALEDVHWLDSRSWDVTLRVARALVAAQLPLLLLVTTRSHTGDEATDAACKTLLTLESVEHIQLGVLPDAGLRALVAARLGVAIDGMADEVIELIQRRAGGNPFFAGELVDALREQALIRLDTHPARYVASPTLVHDEHVLPDTLQGLLLARMDRLAADEQLTLKVAAVVGTTFPYPPLRHVRTSALPTNEAALHQHLEVLVTQEFTSVAAQEPDLAYEFRHILVHEAAYQTLLYAQRRSLHHTVAEWYEGGSSAPLTDQRSPALPLLAHHYRYAEDQVRERHYARLAGLQAADQYANREALAYFTRALELTPQDDLAERFDLMRERMEIHTREENTAALAQELNQMEPLAEALDDSSARAYCMVRRAGHALQISDYPETIAAAQHTLALTDMNNMHTIAAAAHHYWAIALWRQGRLSDALLQSKDMLQLARTQNNRQNEAEALNIIGVILAHQGDWGAATTYYHDCLHLSREIGDGVCVSIVLRNLGGAAIATCDFSAAHTYLVESLRTARATGVTTAERTIPRDLGQIAQAVGDFDAALAMYQESLLLVQAIGGDPIVAGEVYGELARLCWKQNALLAAQTHAEHALTLAQNIGNGSLEASVLITLGHINVSREQPIAAQQAYRAVLDKRRSMGQTASLFEAEAGLARVALATGAVVEALQYVNAILARLETGSLDGTTEPFLVSLTCYNVLVAANDPRATAVLEEAYARLQHVHQSLRDEAWRRTFLQNVPVNRELVAAWRALHPEAEDMAEQTDNEAMLS